MNKNNLIISALFIAVLSFSHAGMTRSLNTEGKWVHCFGEVPVTNMTSEEARDHAIKQARLNAIEVACGINISSESMVKNFMLTSDFIHSFSSGQVVDEKERRWSTKILEAADSTSAPIISIRVDMQALVIESKEKPDPNFSIQLKTNKNTYISGQEVIMEVSSTQDCYLTVLNLAADDTVYVLFPNHLADQLLLEAGKTMQLPDDSMRKMNFHLLVQTLPGHEKDEELIKVIATKQKLPILTDMNLKPGVGKLGTPRFAIWNLARTMAQIPFNERAEATAKIIILNE